MRPIFATLLIAVSGFAQEYDLDQYMLLLKAAPGNSNVEKIKVLNSMGITIRKRQTPMAHNEVTTPGYELPSSRSLPANSPFGAPALLSPNSPQERLGTVSPNPFDPDSIANPYGRYGSRYSPDSVNNPYGQYGSPYSPNSATNPYAIDTPKIIAPDGKYLGKFSSNPYDPDSTANPYGRYGSRYSPDSINNPYGQYSAPVSPARRQATPSATEPRGLGVRAPGLGLPSLPPLRRLPRLSDPD